MGTCKSEQTEDVSKVNKIIVIADICYSSLIFEHLTLSENQKIWAILLIDIQKYLLQERSSVGFELYKFLGDGWIFLFDPRPEGLKIFQFLLALSDKFVSLYKRYIKNVLPTQIPAVGLTFGMDIGSCFRIVMNQQPEYIGEPLNLAARLRSAIEQRDTNYQNKILISKNLFKTFQDKRKIMNQYKVWGVKRDLKKILRGKGYHCLKIERRENPPDCLS